LTRAGKVTSRRMSVDAEHSAHQAYFDDQAARSNSEFWDRFGRRPSFTGKRVLDLGSGHGAMSIEMAQEGATVVGVDPSDELVAFATENARERFPDVAAQLEFTTRDAGELTEDGAFDLAVSKDTFEHVADVPALLRSLHRLLRPGGEVWVGFSPLYYSPRGDHERTGLRLPWAHAVLPESKVLERAAREAGEPVSSLTDLGLNGLTPKAFRAAVTASGLEIETVAYNRGDKALLKALSGLRRVPPLEKFATVSVYAVLRKPA
jgi:ubiquinone/menaquinone biosynthesis C-methylase UbiE